MRLRDLGLVTVEAGSQVAMPSRGRLTVLLAVLAVHVNERVPQDLVMAALWGDDADGDRHRSSFETHVWRLRQILEPGRPAGTSPTVLRNDAGGYRLVVAAEDIDSATFDRLSDEGRDALASGRADRALRRFDAALELWRGRPFAPCSDAEFAVATVARLEDAHAQVTEDRIGVLLDLGRAADALADLGPLIRQQPFRERLHAHRMLALAKQSRIEEALSAYQDTRRLFLSELGTPPGAEVEALHRRILDGGVSPDRDAVVLAPVETQRVSPPRPTRRRARGRESRIVGRAADVGTLTALLADTDLLTVTGPAGCGKTRVATELAAVVADRFLDGVHVVDLAQVDQPDLVVDLALAAMELAVPPASDPYRVLASHMRGRQLLLVLDNCEHLLPGVADVVEGLLAGDGTVVATSREPLGLPSEVVYGLDPLPVPPDAGADSPAVALFLARSADTALTALTAPTADADAARLRIVADICRKLDGLPLAIELAAARTRVFSLTEIAEQVADDPAALTQSVRRPDGASRSLGREIQRSYGYLGPGEQVLHRALSVVPGSFTAAAASALVADVLTGETVIDLIPSLVNASLLTTAPAERRGTVSAYRQLMTVRAHAWSLLADAGESDAVLDRRDAWARSVLGADFRLGPQERDAYLVVDDNYATVRAAVERGLGGRCWVEAARHAAHLAMYWYSRARLVEARRWLERAVAGADRLDAPDEALVRAALVSVLAYQGRADLASPHMTVIERLLGRVPEPALGLVGDLLAVSTGAAHGNEEDQFVQQCRGLTARIAERLADPHLDVLRAATEALIGATGSDPGRGLGAAALTYDRATEDAHWFAAQLSAIAAAYAADALGRMDEALQWSDRAVGAGLTYGSRHGAVTLEVRANLLTRAGRFTEAARTYGAARAQTRRTSGRWPRRDATPVLLQHLRAELSPDVFDAAWQEGQAMSFAELGALVR